MSSPQPYYDEENGGPIREEVERSTMPPSSMNGLTIASIILTVCGIAFGLAAGYYTTEAYNNAWFEEETDEMMAQFFGFLGLASFATATPLLACGARQYQVERGSKGLPVNKIIAWVTFGLGMTYALIVFDATSIGFLDLNYGRTKAEWVYLTILFSVIPYFIMLCHAEYARRR